MEVLEVVGGDCSLNYEAGLTLPFLATARLLFAGLVDVQSALAWIAWVDSRTVGLCWIRLVRALSSKDALPCLKRGGSGSASSSYFLVLLVTGCKTPPAQTAGAENSFRDIGPGIALLCCEELTGVIF